MKIKGFPAEIKEFPFIQKLNRTLPPFTGNHADTTVYLAGVSPAFYYYDVDIRRDSTKRPDFLLKQLEENTSTTQLRSAFILQGMQYILADKQIIEQATISRLPAEGKLWRSFLENYLEVLEEDESFILWKIRAEPLTDEGVDPETGRGIVQLPAPDAGTEALVATEPVEEPTPALAPESLPAGE